MVDTKRETLITIEQAAKLVPANNHSGHVHSSTVRRWLTNGLLDGVRTRTGRILTTREAVTRFIEHGAVDRATAVVPRNEQSESHRLAAARLAAIHGVS